MKFHGSDQNILHARNTGSPLQTHSFVDKRIVKPTLKETQGRFYWRLRYKTIGRQARELGSCLGTVWKRKENVMFSELDRGQVKAKTKTKNLTSPLKRTQTGPQQVPVGGSRSLD